MSAGLLRGFVLLSAMLVSATALAQAYSPPVDDDNGALRLSGIVLDEQRGVAIVESPDGATVMVHEGDTFEGGRVVQISRESMRVQFPQGDRLYWLTADGSKVTDAPPPPAADPVVIERREAPTALLRTVAKVPAVARLDALVATTSQHDTTSVDELLGPLLGLPKQARITQIDHRPLGSTKADIIAIRNSLAQGNVVSLSIEGIPEKDMLYLGASDTQGAQATDPAGNSP
jgi:hypothetical protein